MMLSFLKQKGRKTRGEITFCGEVHHQLVSQWFPELRGYGVAFTPGRVVLPQHLLCLL